MDTTISAAAAHNEADVIIGDMRPNKPAAAEMPAKKWTSTAGPIQFKKVEKVLDRIKAQHNTFKEIFDDTQYGTHVYWSPFGAGKREDVTAAWNALGEQFDWTITRDNYANIIEHGLVCLKTLVENMPCTDKREERAKRDEENAKRRAAAEAHEKERQAKLLPFLAEYSSGPKAPGHFNAVCLQMVFNNSDCRSDYSDPHHSIGPALVLMDVDVRRETEMIARLALNHYPEMAALAWEWHTEKYSMGHGNYLTSEYFDVPEVAKGITDAQRVRWEVIFTSRAEHNYKGFPGTAATSTAEESSGQGVAVRRNLAKAGVEIEFNSKPAQAVIDRVKASGFRWSRFSKVWYARYSPRMWELAHELAGLKVPPINGDQAEQMPDPGEIQADRDCERMGLTSE